MGGCGTREQGNGKNDCGWRCFLKMDRNSVTDKNGKIW